MLKIIKKECIQNIREYKVMLIMTVMPLILIMLMGIAISGAFTQSEIEVADIKVSYIASDSDFNIALEQVLHSFINEDNIIIETSGDSGKSSVQSRDTDVFVTVDEESKTLEFFYNDEFNVKASIIEITLENFIRQYNLTTQVGYLNNTNVDGVIQTRFISELDDITAMDYYGVAMSILFVFYGVPMAISSVIKEKKNGTLSRILLTPTSKLEYLFGKVIGNTLVSVAQITFLMVGTILLFDVSWGNVGMAWLLCVTMVIFGVSIGVALGYVFDNEDKAMGVIHVLIVIFGMFGGSYMPLRDLGLFGQVGKFFSPIWWNMNGLLDMIYGQSYNMLYQAMTVNFIGTFILLSLIAYMMNRKEVAYG
jgi:ABC-2 type transport system permease protein